MNSNDARIAKITVAKTGGDIEEVAPNAPNFGPGSPAPAFDLVLEMEAGGSVGGNYTLTCTAFDHTLGAANPAMDPLPPLNGPGTFAVAPWVVSGGASPDYIFDETVSIQVPAGVQGHVFSYTISLVSASHQQIDTKQSPFFTLV